MPKSSASLTHLRPPRISKHATYVMIRASSWQVYAVALIIPALDLSFAPIDKEPFGPLEYRGALCGPICKVTIIA